jgi:4-hydroxybenzoate polyprenyltransferase
MLPILGAISSVEDLSPRVGLILLMVVPFHIVFAIVNDLADIEVDRGDPRKAGRPLVSGAVSRTTAKIIIAAGVVAAFPADAVLFGFDAARSATLALALAATAFYNIAGKRSPLPPLTDLVQGIGAAAFVHYGGLAAGGAPTSTTYIVEAAVVLYIMLVNGVHGALRDLSSDLTYGARTTPIMFGVRPGPAGPVLRPWFVVHACGLQLLLTAVTTTAVAYDWTKGESDWSAMAAAVAFAAGSILLLMPSLGSSLPMPTRYAVAGTQMLCGFGSIATLAADRYGGVPALLIFLGLAFPLVAKRLFSVSRKLLFLPGRPT